MKYLELNLVCVNVVSSPVGSQHAFEYELFEKVGWTYKIKIATAVFMNINRWK